jgi:hypothetical protein
MLPGGELKGKIRKEQIIAEGFPRALEAEHRGAHEGRPRRRSSRRTMATRGSKISR